MGNHWNGITASPNNNFSLYFLYFLGFKLKSQVLRERQSKADIKNSLTTIVHNGEIWSENSSVLTLYCKFIILFFSQHHNLRNIKLRSSAFPLLLLHLEYLQSLVSSTKV